MLVCAVNINAQDKVQDSINKEKKREADMWRKLSGIDDTTEARLEREEKEERLAKEKAKEIEQKKAIQQKIEERNRIISKYGEETGEWIIANPKAGRLKEKFPEWSKEDCENVARNRIWIGMSLDMLKAERGLPVHVNVSDYGNGKQYQWCWEGDYTTHCFYGGEDGIVTAYN
jgi:hypothetical protein